MSKIRRYRQLNRFNRDPKESSYLSNFQKALFDRMYLNYIDRYSSENIKSILKNGNERYPVSTWDLKIKEGLLLTCEVEPEIYLLIQETAKKVTGDFIAIDKLIYLLLTYFIDTYLYKDEPKKQLPFNRFTKLRSRKKLAAFQKKFSPYYKNIVHNFME